MTDPTPRLWLPVPVLRHRAHTRTVTLPNGERAKVTTDDSGTVRHIERAEGMDAIVRPKTIRLRLRGDANGAR
jgi:hypothetical protein